MVYDPKTDVVTDLGIALKGNGLLTMTMDPKRGRLYAVTYPQAHFLYYDLATGKTTDMGQVQNWDAVGRTLAVDDLGRVYGCWGRGRLYRYDPEKDAIENLQIQLPNARSASRSTGRIGRPSRPSPPSPHSADHKKIYFLETGSSYLVEYDPHKGPEGEMKLLGPARGRPVSREA